MGWKRPQSRQNVAKNAKRLQIVITKVAPLIIAILALVPLVGKCVLKILVVVTNVLSFVMTKSWSRLITKTKPLPLGRGRVQLLKLETWIAPLARPLFQPLAWEVMTPLTSPVMKLNQALARESVEESCPVVIIIVKGSATGSKMLWMISKLEVIAENVNWNAKDLGLRGAITLVLDLAIQTLVFNVVR